MATPDNTDGCMLALYPPPFLAADLAIPGGLPPDELHVTVAYTGHATDVDPGTLEDAAKAVAGDTAPFTARISGHARFTGGDKDVIVALLDAHELNLLRASAEKHCAARSIAIPRDHGYTAHLTLCYIDPDDPDPVGRLPARPVTFTAIAATHAETTTSYPFADTADLAVAAREAYATGWALSGGPMTRRVQAGAIAAVQTALDHAADPRVLEATLQIGTLEGTYAQFFDRRENLIARRAGMVAAAWNDIARDLHPSRDVDRLRAEVGPASHAPDILQAASMGAAAGILSGVYVHDKHNSLQAAIADAIRAAMAEGRAGALALNADHHGHTVEDVFGFDAAYKAIYRQLEHLPDLPLLAQDWIQKLLGSAGRQIGSLMGRLLTSGADNTQIAKAVARELVADERKDTITSRAVTTFVDQAIAAAMSRSSLDLYQSEGVTEVYYVTAGDGKVCPICEGYQDGSPYPPDQCPVPGDDTHPFCRCVLMPENPDPFRALADLLT